MGLIMGPPSGEGGIFYGKVKRKICSVNVTEDNPEITKNTGRFFVISIVLIIIIFTVILIEDASELALQNQWYLNSSEGVGITKLWDATENVDYIPVVAIIDTGIQFNDYTEDYVWINEDELNNGIDDDNNGYVDDFYGWNFYYDTNSISTYQESMYENSHGTFITNILLGNSEVKIYGIVNNEIDIMSLGVLGTNENSINSGTNCNIISAIEYAEKNGADICNMSLDFTELSDEVLETMKNSDMLFVVAAGNNEFKGTAIKKEYNVNNVIVVASTDKNRELDFHCNFGDDVVSVGAPGVDIYNLYINGEPASKRGSSCAVPIVTGIAAELYMLYPQITSKQCKEIICNSSDVVLGLSDYIDSGRIVNAKQALYDLNILLGN